MSHTSVPLRHPNLPFSLASALGSTSRRADPAVGRALDSWRLTNSKPILSIKVKQSKQERVERAPLTRTHYKIKEAAAILGVAPITIRRLLLRGVLSQSRMIRHVLVTAESLSRLLQPSPLEEGDTQQELKTKAPKGGSDPAQ